MEPMPRGACVKDMKWYEMLTPLYEPLEEIDYQCNPRLPPLPTPIDPADTRLNTLPVFTGSQYAGSGDCFVRGDNLMTMNYRAPLHLGYMQPAHLNIGPGGDVTKQYVENYHQSSYEWPLNHPHAPTPPQFYEKAMLILPEGARFPPAEMPSFTDSISPSRKVPTSNKRKSESQEDEEKVYIKKPPNAFMIFRKEQRENVMAQLNIRDSAVANKVLGHMWKSLSEKEQEKYYQLADAEKRLHTQLHPNWSCTDNYGRKRRKQRSRVAPKEILQPNC
ncbi:transcription factor 7-like 1-C isoform X1 [Phycodurus eques]|uniref:transcription factor 7-like 1-C isoform X1 n=1 Tax=Phycodurus eques TaxID=693459 RepID=UPI002ACDA0D4|nr:transcription factor 7-like 1-C isoform X1 [Phycodurus eques]